jgi:hypothetical protein
MKLVEVTTKQEVTAGAYIKVSLPAECIYLATRGSVILGEFSPQLSSCKLAITKVHYNEDKLNTVYTVSEYDNGEHVKDIKITVDRNTSFPEEIYPVIRKLASKYKVKLTKIPMVV